jgi:oligoribonuclease (3'-5' exoribonuclease)
MDPMLEVATILTDMDLVEIEFKRFHALLDLTPWAKTRLEENFYVKDMHERNGLLDAIKITQPLTLEGAEASIMAQIEPFTHEGAILLAGTGVAAFDRQIITHQMPRLDDMLDYRTIDVGHLRRMMKYVVRMDESWMPPSADEGHRARSDVINALVQARVLRDLMQEFAIFKDS